MNKRWNLAQVAAAYVYGNIALTIVYPLFARLLLSPFFGQNVLPSNSSLRLFFLSLLIAAFPTAQLLGIHFIDRCLFHKGKRFAFSLATLLLAFGFFLSAIAFHTGSYILLVISRIWTGFFGGITPLSITCVTEVDQESNKVRTYSPLFHSLYCIGFILGIMLGGGFSDTTIDAVFKNSLPFWIAGAIGVILSGLFFFGMRKDSSCPYYSCHHINLKSLVQIALKTKKQSYFIAFFFFVMSWLAILQFISLFLIENYHASKLFVMMLLLVVGLGWIIGVTIFRSVFTRNREKKSHISVLFICTCICSIIIGLEPNREILFFAFPLIGLFKGIAWGYMMAILAFPKEDVTTQMHFVGYKHLVYLLAAIAAPLAIGLFSMINVNWVYFVASFFTFVSFLIISLKKQSIAPFA